VLGGDLKRRIPTWLKTGLPDAYDLKRVAQKVSSLGLNTICFEARCPNKRECFGRGCATFLVLGKNCTRTCRFCNVAAAAPEPVNAREPERIAQACGDLGLDYVIVTSVTRDDLPDGGSGHFRECVEAIKRGAKPPIVEVLTPDFGGKLSAVDHVATAGIDVFSHNIETVERLYGRVRDRAIYERSLGILEHVRSVFAGIIVKSGLMVGLGETLEEVRSAIRDLCDVGCEIITIGQYMRPSKAHLPVREYIEPAVFDELGYYARDLGLVASCGPKVRSSYLAKTAFYNAKSRRQKCA
jgi:lipoic acid synthetase